MEGNSRASTHCSKRFATFYASWSNASKILNCIVHVKSLSQEVTVDVEPNLITLTSGKRCLRFKLEDLEIKPETCRGLTYLPSGELQFSIQGRSITNTGDDLQFRENMLMSQNELVDRIETLQDKWFCERCQNKILEDNVTFSRVLPLPSENWSDFADTWFCHNHGNGPAHHKTSLLPKSSECFVGDTYLLFDRRHVRSGVVKVTNEGAVLCYRCGRQLGITDGVSNGSVRHGSVFKMFIHAVSITKKMEHSPEKSTVIHNSSQHRDLFFSRLLQEQSQLFTSFRFLVEVKQDTSPVPVSTATCLVWLLDTNVGQYSTIESNLGNKEVSSLEKISVSKVMFKCLLQQTTSPPDSMTKALVSLWRRDEAVHAMVLPHGVLLQLVQILADNCERLPPSQRFLNGFHVSFLRNEAE